MPFLAAFAAKNGIKILFPSLWEGPGVGSQIWYAPPSQRGCGSQMTCVEQI